MTKRAKHSAVKVLFCFVILLSTCLTAFQASADYIRVKGSVVNVRQGPGTTYQVLFQAKQGDKFDLLKTEGLWCLIKLDDGKQAWVFGRLVDILPGEKSLKPDSQTVSKTGRKGPSSIWLDHRNKILIFVGVFFAFVLLLKRRRLAESFRLKLREISGYRREQPFRYDNRKPKDDRWEI
jgi:hypothetical protein